MDVRATSERARFRLLIRLTVVMVLRCKYDVGMRSLRDFLTGGLLLYAAVANAQDVSFGTDVQPILAKRCFACHGPAEQEAGLALNELSTASAELDSGERAIVAGDPDASTLLAAGYFR